MHNKYLFLCIYLIVTLDAQASLMHANIDTEEIIDFLANNKASPLKNITQDIALTYNNPNDLLVDFFKKMQWHYVSHNNEILILDTPETNDLNELLEFKWPNAFLDFSFKQLCLSCMINDNRINDQPSEFELFLGTQSEKVIITFLLNYNSLMSPNKMHIAQSYLIATMCTDFAKKNPFYYLYKTLMATILFHATSKTYIPNVQPIILLMVDLLHDTYRFLTKQFFLEHWQKTIQAMIYKYFYNYGIHNPSTLDKDLSKKSDIKSILDITVPLPPFAKIKILNGHLDLSSCCLTNHNILPRTPSRYCQSSGFLIDHKEHTKYNTTRDLLWGCVGPAVWTSDPEYIILKEIIELSLYNNPSLTSQKIYLLMHAFPDLKKINIDEALFEDIQKNMPLQEKYILLKTDAKCRCPRNEYDEDRLVLKDLANPSPLIIQCNNITQDLRNIYKEIYKHHLFKPIIFDQIILSEQYSFTAQSLVFIFWHIVSKYYLNNEAINLSILSLIATVCTPFITLPITHEIVIDKTKNNSEEKCTKSLWKAKIVSWLFNKLFIISLNALCISILTKDVLHSNNENTGNSYFILHVLCSTSAINCIYLARSFQIDYVAAFALKELYLKREPFIHS